LGLSIENGISLWGIKSYERGENIKFARNFLLIFRNRRSGTKIWLANWIRNPSSPYRKIWISPFYPCNLSGKWKCQIFHLKSTAAKLKFKGIGGGFYQRWNTWLNAILNAKPYQALYSNTQVKIVSLKMFLQVLHGCRQFMSWDFWLSPWMNETLFHC